jgi:hypothetical protein
MTTNHCPVTERLVRSGSRRLDPALQDHAMGCPSCRDALLVSSALAVAAADDAPLPDPRVLWLRAKSEARARAARRAVRILDVVQLAAIALVAGGLATAAVAFSSPVTVLLARTFGALAATPGLFGVPLLAAAAGLALLVPPLVALADRI